MPDDDAKASFFAAGTSARLQMVGEAKRGGPLHKALGEDAFAEYLLLARRARVGHLAFDAPKNLVFLPGVMGSLLQSRTRGGIWWLDVRTRDKIDRLGLALDGERDAAADDDIGPVTSDPSYDPFLCAILEQPDFGHDIFAYDWRKSPRASAAALRDRIASLHAGNGRRPVHVVAHSMGGLIVRAALMAHGDELWPMIGRIAFLGTPHYGSPSISGYLKNHLWGFDAMVVLGRYLSRSTLRSLPGVIGMLPAPRGVYPGTRDGDPHPWATDAAEDAYIHPCCNFDMYDAARWELGLDPKELADLQHVLVETASLHRDLHGAQKRMLEERRQRMVTIVGVGFRTLFRLAYEPGFLGLWERAGKFLDRVDGDVHREGDGRVPVASAMLDGVSARFVRGEHGSLPNIPVVQADVFRFLRGKPMELPTTKAGALADHLADGLLSGAPSLDGSCKAVPSVGDPGYWDLEPPDPEQTNDLERRLAAGALPDFERLRIL